jgi:hypothetical protein
MIGVSKNKFMILFFFLALISIAVSILIIREFILLASKYYKLNKELEKYNSKNRYEIKKLITHIKKCNEIIKSAETLEEKEHWYKLKIDAFKEIEEIAPIGLLETIKAKLNKNTKILNTIEKKSLSEKKHSPKTTSDGSMGVA